MLNSHIRSISAKSKFNEMFGNPITNSQNRPLTRFDNVITLQRGYDLPDCKRKSNGMYPVYGSNGLVGYHDSPMAKNGIVTGRSGTIGQVHTIRGDYWPLNTTLFSIDTHGNNIVYLGTLLKCFDLTRFYSGTGVPTLNRNDLHKELIYDIPIDQQVVFATYAEQCDKLKFNGMSSKGLPLTFIR